MISNSNNFSEIVRVRSRWNPKQVLDEIETFGFGEIKSALYPDEVGFHRTAISPEHSEDFTRPQGRI